MSDKYYITDDNGNTYIYKQPAEIEIDFEKLPLDIQEQIIKEADTTGKSIEEITTEALTDYCNKKIKEIVKAAREKRQEPEQE